MRFTPLFLLPFFFLLNDALLHHRRHGISSVSAVDITTIAPDTESCAGASFISECANASHAAPFVSLSFANYGITSFGAQAGLLALMLYESGSFKYNKNHWPGVPGQGTRNMQSPSYNLKYATWLATYVSNSGITLDTVAVAEAEGPDAVLGLVECDAWSFASAAWFLKTQCDATIEQGLADQTDQGWEDYLTICVGTTVTDERTAIWKKAVALQRW